MSKWEVSYWLLNHPIVMLSIYGLFTLCFDHIDVRSHFLYFLFLDISLLLDVLLNFLMLVIKNTSLGIDFFLFLLLLLNLSLLHALKVLIKETPPLYSTWLLVKE